MRKNLKMLDELQEIDLKIDGFKGEKEALLAEAAALDAKVAELLSAIAEKKGELAALEEEKQKLEESIAVEMENIARAEAHQKEIKTQKEYQAVSKEIATAKKLKAELDEQILQKIGQADALKADIASLEDNQTELAGNVAAEKVVVQENIARLEEGIAQDFAAREEVVKVLPPMMLKRYGRLREQRRGIAVVEARDGSCLGCNMQLPPQLYNSLFRGDEIITCPHCQRVLLLRRNEEK